MFGRGFCQKNLTSYLGQTGVYRDEEIMFLAFILGSKMFVA